MPVGTNAQSVAAQLEKVRGLPLSEMFQLNTTLWKEFEALPSDKVSTRPERIVYEVYPGGKSRVVNLDGGDMGRGGFGVLAYGNLAPVYFDWIFEWTKLAEIGTNSTAKSAVDYVSEFLKKRIPIASFNLDSLISYGDGSNTLGVVTPNTNLTGSPFYDGTNLIIYVDNANRFYAGQDVDFYNGGLGTASTGTVTILGIDANNKALYITAAPTTAPVSGALILQNNSTGVANSGLNGILAYQVNSNTGTYTGVQRSQYPGAFTTPTVNAGGNTLTPALARLLLNQMKIARGIEIKPNSRAKFFMGLDQMAAWENTGIVVTQNIQAGNATGRDMLPAEPVNTIGGIPIIPSLKAIPGRIDLLDFSTWFRQEIQPLDFYEVDGQTMFWPMGASGGIAASMLSYLFWGGNIGCQNPRANAYISNLAIPAGY